MAQIFFRPFPKAHDVRLPAEWETQSGIQLTWVNQECAWGEDRACIEHFLARIAKEASTGGHVLIGCENPSAVQSILDEHGVDPTRVRLFRVASDDVWVRDHGPITVLDDVGLPLLLHFQFNGWGGKFPYGADAELVDQLHKQGAYGNTPILKIPFVLEGGAIDCDGAETLLTTASVLFDPKRNPNTDAEQCVSLLFTFLGVERIVVLEHGRLSGDDTDGHVDTVARFCTDNTIAYTQAEDAHHPDYAELKAMEMELMNLRTLEGAPYCLIPLPLPRLCLDAEGHPLPATYANFLITNDAVLVPTYNDPNDEVALARLADAYPPRRIVGIDCTTAIKEHGALHCMTMQLPVGVLT